MKVEFRDRAPVHDQFEQQYIALRKKEGRLYSDEEVQLLPFAPANHPLAKEWKMRSFSAEKLAMYLKQKDTPQRILEVGCGNGWLSHRLALLPGSYVTGTDINSTELDQAKRVFTETNLEFINGDIRHGIIKERFDAVVFAASLQYFSSLREIVNAALKQLVPGGEVHILDTHFYRYYQLEQAEQRTKRYFIEQGFPSMKDYYFHHSLEALDAYSFEILYDPNTLSNRIFKRSPFHWIRIRKC
jgi:ubiquinone/menaquinone biosynthesis C-methylase UbiE